MPTSTGATPADPPQAERSISPRKMLCASPSSPTGLKLRQKEYQVHVCSLGSSQGRHTPPGHCAQVTNLLTLSPAPEIGNTTYHPGLPQGSSEIRAHCSPNRQLHFFTLYNSVYKLIFCQHTQILVILKGQQRKYLCMSLLAACC